MATCVTCSTEFPDSLGACPQCRTPLTDVATFGDADAQETRLASAPTPASASGKTGSSTTGWLSASGAIDHGRFPPGTLLGGRYRIVGRLGRGGMGEVYRADDLKLGQPVALKFLPPDVDRDPSRLIQLHTEVRMARQVSHPNVCRVYDIDDVDGHTFLSMEYVDGEDLASLLRRIGRFSTERAIEIARQICAGLAAAHDCGVVHRDLKPANVMLDATGKVRVTDFGLAGATGESLRAGTPAYMAPEQLAGSEVTVRSDIYALGLVLYELFTGRRALDGKTIAELVRQREEGAVVPPSEVIRDLDPSIDRAVMRCLERVPEARPASALAVAAALPGGDPLAVALAAGETPSPEMVAASGSTSALGALPAIAALVATLTMLFGLAVIAERNSIVNLVPTSKPPAVLADRATQVARELGYMEPVSDRASGFALASDYFGYARSHSAAFARDLLRTGQPAILYYWHRTSPAQLVPPGDRSRVTYTEPPLVVPGMVALQLDTEGRLIDFAAVPAQVVEPDAAAAVPAWDRLFQAAGLDQRSFTSVPSTWTPRTYADARVAWEGPAPGWPDLKLRVEAAAFRGRVVDFRLIAPWTKGAAPIQPAGGISGWLQTIVLLIVISLLAGAALVARHNWRRGRGDRRGALRLGGVILAVAMASWLLDAAHVPALSVEIGRFFAGQEVALWSASMIWLLYMALEPYVRKFWPSTLVTWSRLLSGDVLDPLVGRDILVGCLLGVGLELLDGVTALLQPTLGYRLTPSVSLRPSDLDGLRYVLASCGNAVLNALFNALWAIFGVVVLRLIFRRGWLVALVAMLLFMLTSITSFVGSPGSVGGNLVVGTISIAAVLWLMLRFGLLATSVYFFFNFFVAHSALTLDPERWFFTTSLWTLAVAAAIACYGFYAARGGEPLLGRPILE